MAQVTELPADAAVERLRRRLSTHVATNVPNSAGEGSAAGGQLPLVNHTSWGDSAPAPRPVVSAAVPRLATYAPTGGTVAAPTRSSLTLEHVTGSETDLRLVLFDSLVSLFAGFGVAGGLAFFALVLAGHIVG